MPERRGFFSAVQFFFLGQSGRVPRPHDGKRGFAMRAREGGYQYDRNT